MISLRSHFVYLACTLFMWSAANHYAAEGNWLVAAGSVFFIISYVFYALSEARENADVRKLETRIAHNEGYLHCRQRKQS